MYILSEYFFHQHRFLKIIIFFFNFIKLIIILFVDCTPSPMGELFFWTSAGSLGHNSFSFISFPWASPVWRLKATEQCTEITPPDSSRSSSPTLESKSRSMFLADGWWHHAVHSHGSNLQTFLDAKYSERLWGTGDWGSVRGRGRGTRDLCILGHSACGLNHAQWAAAQIKNTFQKRKNRETHRQRATTRT